MATAPTRPPRGGLLRDRDFRGLFLSTTVSQFGQQVTALALPLVAVLALESGELEVGALSALTTLAFLLIGLPAGAWVDRMRRRRVLIAADLVRAAILLTVPLAWWTGTLTIWQLFAVALVLGVFTVFFDVAYQSYLPHLVGRANLVEGNAKLEAVRSTAGLGGPALAGQLIAWLTAPVALAFDALAMGASALFVVRIRRREPAPEVPADAKLLADIREGLAFVLGHRLLRAIVGCTGWYNLCFAAFMAMLVVYLPRDLGLGPGAIGLLMSMFGLGGLLGALVVRRAAAWIGEGRLIWVSVAATAPFALLVPAAEPGWRIWAAGAGMVVIGVSVVVYNVTQVSFRQRVTPDRLLGRMNATVRFLVWGTQPIGALIGGALGHLYGAEGALWIAALAGCLAFLPPFLSPLRSMRDLPESAEPERPAPV
ncbi:MFS transporter [Glycomyces xiaoerkulensis]|uniref:MFS transporter n=1 Tax=Glycomyces xiaoerkulensis TaxID=2038139 RepID=UPI000C259ABE|nr:MFS transporter [Glycomyces xiaoerkulensis]